MQRTVKIGIAGASGSGKTTLASALERALTQAGEPVTVIHADTFYKREGVFPQMRSPLTGELMPDWNTPDAIRIEALEEAFDKACEAGGIVIIEGAFLFCFESIREKLDLRVFTDAPIETRIYRRIHRNMANGLELEEIADYYLQAARFSEKKNTLNTIHTADFVVNTEGDSGRQVRLLTRLIETLKTGD